MASERLILRCPTEQTVARMRRSDGQRRTGRESARVAASSSRFPGAPKDRRSNRPEIEPTLSSRAQSPVCDLPGFFGPLD